MSNGKIRRQAQINAINHHLNRPQEMYNADGNFNVGHIFIQRTLQGWSVSVIMGAGGSELDLATGMTGAELDRWIAGATYVSLTMQV